MNITALETALAAVEIPGSSRTLGSENAVTSITEQADGLHLLA